MPSGAMYMMVKIEQSGFSQTFDNDFEIVKALVTEQSIFCLPGNCFNIPNFFRIVLTVPKEMLIEACDRMEEFFKKYYDHHILGMEMACFFMEEDSTYTDHQQANDHQLTEKNSTTKKFSATLIVEALSNSKLSQDKQF